MPVTHAGVQEGSSLGKYQVVRRVAAGGMGTVWLGRVSGPYGFERSVAIKTMLPELAQVEQFRRMFLDEGRVACRLNHPNIAQVVDLGEEGDELFLVLEWVDGTTLDRLVSWLGRAGTTLPLGVALRIAAEACAGLHAAHELRGADGAPLLLVHRDVSPQNLMVGTSGVTKVIDFGIAKARERLAAETTEGHARGKVAYMAPEQATGSLVDRRADVWGLGATLYRVISGRLPFERLDELLGYMRGITPAPPFGPEVPEPIVACVRKALAPTPRARFATTLAMQEEIERIIQTLGLHVPTHDVATLASLGMIPDDVPPVADPTEGDATLPSGKAEAPTR